MSRHPLITRIALLALLAVSGRAAPAWAAAGEAGAGDVYFVGVDLAPAGGEGRKLAALFGADPDDRWALTETVKRIARGLGDQSVRLDAPLGHWNPANDPYNFGLIVVYRAAHSSITWPGNGSRTDIEFDLGWLQIGHDPRTRMLDDKVPELRFAVPFHDVVAQGSDEPPTEGDVQQMYRAAFTSAVGKLLSIVRLRYLRDLDRSAADVRYVVVTPAVIQPEAQRQLSGFVDTQQLGDTAAAYLERRLMTEFAQDHSFDDVALLPNASAVGYLQSEWSSFARRVAALSTYSAAWQATGFHAPRLLRAVPLCQAAGEDQVHALEIRSSVLAVTWRARPKNPSVEYADTKVLMAADIKLPLDAGRSRAPGAVDLPPVHRTAVSEGQPKPAELEIRSFVGPPAVQMGIVKATDLLAGDLAQRLRDVLRDTEPLSHPSYQGSCREH